MSDRRHPVVNTNVMALSRTATIVGLAIDHPSSPLIGGVRIDIQGADAIVSSTNHEQVARMVMRNVATGPPLSTVITYADLAHLLPAPAEMSHRDQTRPVTLALGDTPSISLDGWTMPLEATDAASYALWATPNTTDSQAVTRPAPPVATVRQMPLADLVTRVASATHSDEALPMFTAVQVSVDSGRVLLVANNRIRAARAVVRADTSMATPVTLALPAGFLRRAARCLPGPHVTIGYDPVEGWVTLHSGEALLAARPLPVPILPDVTDRSRPVRCAVLANRDRLLTLAEGAAKVLAVKNRARPPRVKVSVTGGKLRVTPIIGQPLQVPDMAVVAMVIEGEQARMTSADLEVELLAPVLLDTLATFPTWQQDVTLHLPSGRDPVIITDEPDGLADPDSVRQAMSWAGRPTAGV